MGEAKRRRSVLGPVELKMNPVPVVCSKCQSGGNAIPGTAHIDCGGTYIPTNIKPVKFNFSSPLAMTVFMMLDRLVSDCNFLAGQFNFMNQANLAQEVGKFTAAAQNMRDQFYKQDQGGIQVVGANGLPKS